MKIASPALNATQHQPLTSDSTPPATTRLGNARLRLLDADNRLFEKGMSRSVGHRQSPELKALKQAVHNYQAGKAPSLAGLEKIEQALQFWLDSGKNRSRQQDPVLQQLVADIAARRQALGQGGSAPSFQLAWVCNEQGRVNQPIESNQQIRQWTSELVSLQKEGANDLFRRELQGGLDLMFGVSEGMMARRLGRAPTREEVADSHEWKVFCGNLRQALPALGELKPQATAEENSRDILLTHSQLLELTHLKEVLALGIEQKVIQQGEIGLLRTELLTVLVDGLEEPWLAREGQEKALWQGESQSGKRYQTGVRAELKSPTSTVAKELKPNQPVSREAFSGLGLVSASSLVEAFAKIEIGQWEGRRDTPLGEFAGKVTLTQENKASVKAELVVGLAGGELASTEDDSTKADDNKGYEFGPHDVSLLRIGASAELVSKLALSAEASWTVGNLLNVKLAGSAEVGASAMLEAGASVIMTPAGPVLSATAKASAFAGLKAEGSSEFNLFKSKYADAYSLSATVRGAATLGAGAQAGATVAFGRNGTKFHTDVGITLGVGAEVGWEGSINAMATKAYALELAARAVTNFDQRKGAQLDGLAMASGNEHRLYELALRVDSRIGTLNAQLDELQSAASENRIRMQESLIDPDIAAGRTAMAQAIDDAFGLERVDGQGVVTVPARAAERNEKLELTARMLRDNAIKV
jgi:type III secretion system cytotoxic effector protein